MRRFSRTVFPFLLLPLLIGADYQVARAQTHPPTSEDVRSFIKRFENQINSNPQLVDALNDSIQQWGSQIVISESREVHPPTSAAGCDGTGITHQPEGLSLLIEMRTPLSSSDQSEPLLSTPELCDSLHIALTNPQDPPRIPGEIPRIIEDLSKPTPTPTTTPAPTISTSVLAQYLYPLTPRPIVCEESQGKPWYERVGWHSVDIDVAPDERTKTARVIGGDRLIQLREDGTSTFGGIFRGNFERLEKDSLIYSTSTVSLGLGVSFLTGGFRISFECFAQKEFTNY